MKKCFAVISVIVLINSSVAFAQPVSKYSPRELDSLKVLLNYEMIAPNSGHEVYYVIGKFERKQKEVSAVWENINKGSYVVTHSTVYTEAYNSVYAYKETNRDWIKKYAECPGYLSKEYSFTWIQNKEVLTEAEFYARYRDKKNPLNLTMPSACYTNIREWLIKYLGSDITSSPMDHNQTAYFSETDVQNLLSKLREVERSKPIYVEEIDANGNSYKGYRQNGLKNGWGKYTWVSGNSYEGEWIDDAQTGFAKYQWVSGSYHAGMWVDGNRVGYGLQVYKDGSIRKGMWANDEYVEGSEELFDPSYFELNNFEIPVEYKDGYVGEKSNGKYHGKGKYTYKTGAYYDGDWVEGNKHGKGTYRWASGTIYEGDWQMNVCTGTGTMTWTDQSTYTGDFINDKRTGKGKTTWASGSYYQGDYVDGKEHGIGFFFYKSNGDKFYGLYVNGEREGDGVYQYADGTMKIGVWKSGEYVPNSEKLFNKRNLPDYQQVLGGG